MLSKFLCCLSSIYLMACSALVPEPTATSSLTFTPLPSLTPIPTHTAQPIITATLFPPTETPVTLAGLIPQGKPEAEWNGIPIMPDAIAGEADAESYRFTIQASREEIQTYYGLELPKLGWNLLTIGESANGSLIMFFTGSEGTLSVSILSNGEGVIVLIVK